MFIIAPVLQNFNPEKPVIIETDASDYVTADILSQPDEKGNLHLMIFFFNKMSLKQCNYKIYDKELLVIVKAFEEWHSETHGTVNLMIVLTDHKNQKYFITTHKFNYHQAHWNEFLFKFNFKIIYQSEVINHATDALTCLASDYLHNERDLWNAHQYQAIFGGQQLQLNMFNIYDFGVVNAVIIALVTFQS